jgi:hypothetical protein
VLRSRNGVPFFNSYRLIDEAHSRMEFGDRRRCWEYWRIEKGRCSVVYFWFVLCFKLNRVCIIVNTICNLSVYSVSDNVRCEVKTLDLIHISHPTLTKKGSEGLAWENSHKTTITITIIEISWVDVFYSCILNINNHSNLIQE